MKYIKQLGIILTISFIGELMKAIIPLQIPGSIYGLFLMLIALKTKIIPLDDVKDVGKFLIEIMPIMFIPAAVGLLDAWDSLKPIFFPVIVITVVSTLAVMIISGKVTQSIIRSNKK